MRRAIVILAAGLLAAGAVNANVNIETVPVGNPGNAADTRYDTWGFGAVAYAYNIGKYEVTAGQYTEFLNKVAGVDAYGLYSTFMSNTGYGSGIERSGGGTVGDPYTYTVASAFVNRPVNYVSWGDAARFANWLHNGQPAGAQNLSTTEDGAYFLNGATTGAPLLAVNREADWQWAITNENEWYKAAYYKSGSTNAGYWDYPTSSDVAPGRDMDDVSGNNANYYDGSVPYPIDSPYYTTVAGEFQNSASPYGTFDQGGNVWEWNESVVSGGFRGMRGSSFSYGGAYWLAAARRLAEDPTAGSHSIGFRVSQVPEPASLVLVAFASLGIVGRRR